MRRKQTHKLAENTPNILSEVFSQTPSDAGAVGFILSHIAQTDAPILWVQDRMSLLETGHPYLPALGARS